MTHFLNMNLSKGKPSYHHPASPPTTLLENSVFEQKQMLHYVMQQFAKVSTGVIQHMARRPGATHQGIQFSLLFLKTVNVEKKKIQKP